VACAAASRSVPSSALVSVWVVGPVHLLLALLHDDAGPAARLLGEAGASREALLRRLPRPSRRPPRGLPEVSADLRRLFERSLREALDRGSDRLDSLHLLIALACSGGGAATRALADSGVDRAALLERLPSPERNVRTAA
jgi:ATP-dependent Clp protease ATP-binding subunit ClpA